MSTNINKTTIDIELDGTEIVPTYSTDITVTNDQCVEIENPESLVSGSKKEYSIVGDGLYASISTDEAPEWLTSIIDDVVDGAVNRGLTNYNDLIQDVRDAIDSIDTAKNRYVEQVSINAIVDGIVVSRLAQLNATVGSNSSTITDLDFAVSTLNSTFAQRVVDIVSDYDNTTNARITQVNNTLANADTAIANSVTALSSRLNDQESDLEGTAGAVSGLQTYVGLTDFNYPNGTGMLSRLNIIEKQNDGVIEYTVSTVDPMQGVDADDTTPNDNQLLTDLEPYATWAAADTALEEAANADLEEGEEPLEIEETRAAHIGDVYIVYADDSNGVRTYVKSYKFIKTAVDEDSPFSTDTEGYTWALITDTDAQSAYVIALNAQDLADSKRRVFTQTPFPPYDKGDLWVDSSVTPQIVKTATNEEERTDAYYSSDWVQADQQAQDFITNTYTPDSNQIHRQLDGKIEYYFYESSTDLIDPETSEGALSESIALDVIASAWTTQATRDNENGNVVYFKNTRNAYWYQASNNEWAAIVDTSIYEALQDASTAQGAADGKVSQFYAFGDNEAPEDFTIPAVYQTDIDGNYLNSNGDVTTTSTEYVVLRPEETVSASSFTYWFDSTSTPELKHKNASDAWVAVPIGPDSLTAGISTFLAEGDLLTVVDKTTGDLSVYSFNGTSWQSSGPTGILSKSKWFVDLDNAVKNSDGKIAKAAADVIVTSEAYTNDQVTGAKSTFLYTTNLEVGGITYDAGFGLNADLSQLEDGETVAESEFWVDAGKFVLKNPNEGGPDAVFTPTATGLTLGLEYTEATRNDPKGVWVATDTYIKGDMVVYEASSYVALKSVPAGNLPDAEDSTYWQLLVEGKLGVSYTGTEEYYKLTNDSETVPERYSSDTTIDSSWSTTPQTPTSTNKYLWNFNRNNKDDNTFTDSDVFLLTQYVKDGKGISSITEAYLVNNSGTTAPELDSNDWDADVQTPTNANPYLWNRTTIAYTEGEDTVIATLIAIKGDLGTPADNYKEIFLYQNASSVPTSLPTNVQGFTAASGNSAATGDWTVSASAPTAPASTYRINITVKQTNNTGNWAAVDASWNGPVQLSALDGSSSLEKTDLLRYKKPFTAGSGSTAFWNGPNDGNDVRELDYTPFGGTDVIWKAINNGVDNDADGGFDADYISIDNTKTYRFSVFIKQFTVNGTKYLGTHGGGSHVRDMAGTAANNPYFWAGDLPENNKWYLVTGFVHRHDVGTSAPFNGAIYDVATGQKVVENTASFKWDPSTISTHIRMYQYYNTSASADEVWFWEPRIDLMDKDAPSAQELLRTATSADTFKDIYLYKNSATQPAVPSIAGSFDSSTGTAEDEDTWTVSSTSPSEGEFTWRTSLTIVKKGSTGAWVNSDSAWNSPVRMTGEVGPKGDTVKGDRGTAVLNHSARIPATGDTATAPGSVTATSLGTYWNTAAPTIYDDEIVGDTLILTNTHPTGGWTHIYEYTATGWASSTEFIVNGNMVVEGTLSAAAIGTGTLSADFIGGGYIATNSLEESPAPGTAPIGATYDGTIMDSKGIKVYDGGVLRVKLGDLS